MGDKIKLALEKRELHGKKVAQLRKNGLTPAVVYGPGIDPISLQIEDGLMLRTYQKAGTYTPINLEVGSKKMIVMIKDIDRDPVRGTIRHVSFHAVNAKDPVNAEVPIHLIGESEMVLLFCRTSKRSKSAHYRWIFQMRLKFLL